MLERTLFSRLALRGEGTGQVQSLRSYITLLALAHNLKPRKLLDVLASHYPDVPVTTAAMGLIGDANIHSGGDVSARLRSALEGATGARLRNSTLEPLAQAFSMHRTCGTGEVRYCPVCIREDRDMPYGRLLWDMSFVEACPVHAVRLQPHRVCGAPASEQLPLQHRPVLDGVCSACGSIGFKCLSSDPIAADSDAVALSTEAERLLAAMCEAQVDFHAETVREGIAKAVEHQYDGKVVKASEHAGLSRGSVCVWLQSGKKASLPMVLQFCIRSGVDALALCRGEFERRSPGRGSTLRVRINYKRSNVSTATLKKALVDAAQSENPPSVYSFAREFNLHCDAPRQRAPEEARQLAAAHAAYEKQRVQAQFGYYVRTFAEAAQCLRREGRTVHRRALQEKSGLATFSRGLRRVALDQVLAQFANPVLTNSQPTSSPATDRVGLLLESLTAQVMQNQSERVARTGKANRA